MVACIVSHVKRCIKASSKMEISSERSSTFYRTELETSQPYPLCINLLLYASTLSPNIETHVSVWLKQQVQHLMCCQCAFKYATKPNPLQGHFFLDMHAVYSRYLNTLCIPRAKMAHRLKKQSITQQSWTAKVVPRNHTGSKRT